MSDDDSYSAADSAAPVGVNFRSALRGMFAAALQRLAADGVVVIAADDVPGLV